MCEYCGCQALPAIEELTREHDMVVTLVSRVRGAHLAHDVPELAVLARAIATVLEPHTAVEEQGLFPALSADFPDQGAALHADHRRIEAVLGEAAEGVGHASAPSCRRAVTPHDDVAVRFRITRRNRPVPTRVRWTRVSGGQE